jgi:hypothetical protein
VKYLSKGGEQTGKLTGFDIARVSREESALANRLPKIIATKPGLVPWGICVETLGEQSITKEVVMTVSPDEANWMTPILNCL